MRLGEVDDAIARFERLLKESKLVHEREVREVLRELKKIRRAGAVDPRRLTKVVANLSELLCDEFLT